MSNPNSISKQELDQVISTCVCFNFRKVTRLVTQHFDEVLKPSGLLITQFTILVAIAKLKAVTVNELAERLVMDRTTLTRNIKPLMRSGWISMEPGQDKRTRVISLTQYGEQVLADSWPLWQQAQAQIIEVLGESQWSRLLPQLAEATKRLQD
jgi:DNA-binding MarR family transcriptional regulator